MCSTFCELASKHIRSLSPNISLSQAGSWTQAPSWTSLKAGPARPLSQRLLKTSTKQKLCHRSRRFNSFDQFFRGNVWMKFLSLRSIEFWLKKKNIFASIFSSVKQLLLPLMQKFRRAQDWVKRSSNSYFWKCPLLLRNGRQRRRRWRRWRRWRRPAVRKRRKRSVTASATLRTNENATPIKAHRSAVKVTIRKEASS